MSQKLVYLVLFLATVNAQTDWEEEDDTITTVSVDAVLGRTASLPCDIEPETKDDRVYMVLWFRESAGKPLYSFDVRGRSFPSALHWSDPLSLGPRAFFATIAQPATLQLDAVTLDDEGAFRCRVDFKHGPTRNVRVVLNVVVPPHQLFLFDNSGRILTDVVGPLEEGADLILLCEVRGGRPPPTITWFSNDLIIQGHSSLQQHIIVSKLEIQRVKRHHLNTTIKCQASNTKLTMPVEKTVRVEMLLRPLSVTIQPKPHQMEAGAEYTVVCTAVGSRPMAVVTWVRGGRRFQRGKISQQSNETSVTSTLSFYPLAEDDNTVLKCVAENPSLKGTELEDSFLLNVVYPPQVILNLGSTLNAEEIKEGDDVYFECSIKANPKVGRISWIHNNQQVLQNITSGIIISTHSLVLQKVTRHQSGDYYCVAINNKGESKSGVVKLRVRYPPVCSAAPVTIGATLEELIHIGCYVTADPPDVTFSWMFSNSGESFDVANARFTNGNNRSYDNKNRNEGKSGFDSNREKRDNNEDSQNNLNGNDDNKEESNVTRKHEAISVLTYKAESQRDYGTLTCWGENKVGRQIEPCLFQVVPAAKPSQPSNCTLTPINSSLIIQCTEGYDGGLPQRFVLQVFDSKSLKLNVTSEAAKFKVDVEELLEEQNEAVTLRLLIFAENAKGKSEAVELEQVRLNESEKRLDGTTINLLPLATILTFIILTLGIAVLFIVVLTIRKKRDTLIDNCHIDVSNVKPQKLSPLTPVGAPAGTFGTPRGFTGAPGAPTEGRRFVVAYTQERRPDVVFTNRAAPEGAPQTLPPLIFTKPITTTYSARRENLYDSIPGPESCV